MSYVKHYEGERKQDRPTPRDFFEKLHERFSFTVDGAANPDGSNSMLPRWFAAHQSWRGERVFCNPPWNDIRPFVMLAGETADFACLLVPARTNCRWFHYALELGAKPEFFLGKLSFGGPWNSPVDCLLLLFGNDERRLPDEAMGAREALWSATKTKAGIGQPPLPADRTRGLDYLPHAESNSEGIEQPVLRENCPDYRSQIGANQRKQP